MASTLVTPPAEYNLTRNPIYITLESDEFTGASAPYTPAQDNLSAHVEVWRDIAGGEEKLITIKSPYSTIDKRTSFDISGVFPQVVALPSAASIGVEAGDPLYDEAVGLTDVFRLKHADQYGDPVAVEALTTSADYLAINGGLPEDAIQSVNLSAALIGLHSYYFKRNDAFPFYKPVATHQPDYLYFIALLTGDIEVTVTRFYDDGTNDFYVALTMPVTANKAYWVQAGHDQLHVPIDAAVGKTILGYSVSLIRSGQNAFTAYYVIDTMCPSWERFILYHNGFGGYETVRMKGLTKYSHQVTRDPFVRVKWIDFNIQDGNIDQIRTDGNCVFNTHTGHYPAYYIEHLRQLLHGKLWLIDLDLADALSTYRFKRIMCETNQVEIRTDEAGPDGFAITYRNAWTDDGFNIY